MTATINTNTDAQSVTLDVPINTTPAANAQERAERGELLTTAQQFGEAFSDYAFDVCAQAERETQTTRKLMSAAATARVLDQAVRAGLLPATPPVSGFGRGDKRLKKWARDTDTRATLAQLVTDLPEVGEYLALSLLNAQAASTLDAWAGFDHTREEHAATDTEDEAEMSLLRRCFFSFLQARGFLYDWQKAHLSVLDVLSEDYDEEADEGAALVTDENVSRLIGQNIEAAMHEATLQKAPTVKTPDGIKYTVSKEFRDFAVAATFFVLTFITKQTEREKPHRPTRKLIRCAHCCRPYCCSCGSDPTTLADVNRPRGW